MTTEINKSVPFRNLNFIFHFIHISAPFDVVRKIIIATMCLKIKTLFKITCLISAIVLICYIELKFNFIFAKSNKEEMATRRILVSDFEVFGTVQGEMWQ